jgi:enoyl-CoA hydratase
MTDAELIVAREGKLGQLRLNRPDALNALTLDMALEMEKALLGWRNDGDVETVVVCGTGDRAFCAGGDIQYLFETGQQNPEPGRRFWRDEYRLNALINAYPKPYVALMNGITMGGGVGVSAHGSHRIATENTMLAMPEVSIGFLPDVGGTWLLSRAPGETGLYLGLTGARMKAADAMFAGFANSYVPSQALEPLVERLADGVSPDEAIDNFAQEAPEGALPGLQEKITRAFAHDNLKTCLKALEEMAAEGDEWAQKAAAMIGKNAPLAVATTFAAIRRARKFTALEESLSLEYCFAHRAIAGHDFLEGIRAMVIDKDRKPQWRPASLDEVTPGMVDELLAPLGEEAWKAA